LLIKFYHILLEQLFLNVHTKQISIVKLPKWTGILKIQWCYWPMYWVVRRSLIVSGEIVAFLLFTFLHLSFIDTTIACIKTNLFSRLIPCPFQFPPLINPEILWATATMENSSVWCIQIIVYQWLRQVTLK